MRLRLLFMSLLVVAGIGAGTAGAGTLCTGDGCVITSPFDGLRADIATNAPTRLVRLFTFEANLSQAFHPPGPCTPGSCVASQLVLIALDLQVRGLPTQGCPGGCSFNATNAYVLDHDIRGILTNTDVYPLNLQIVPPGPPCTPSSCAASVITGSQ